MRVVLIVAALAMGGAVVVPFSLAADKPHHHKKKHKHKKKPVVTPTATPSGQSASADLTSGPFHITFDARRNAGLSSKSGTGTFRGELPGGTYFSGPITCLDVVGDDIGLFYPVTDANPPSVANTGLSVFVTVQTDGHGHPTNVGFNPVLSPVIDGCAPGMAALAAEGSATATGG